MSTIKANTLTVKCGSTLTLGESGKTIAIASGASTSGMGRAGAVDWQTGSIKTTTFTAVSGEGYFVDTSSGAVTANLPAGTAGAIVSLSDYTRTFQTNNLTVAPNGSQKIGGVAANAILTTKGQTATFVYVDSTEGWINTQETSNSVTGRSFITATGGTITTSGNFKIHSFTSPGTFCVSSISTCTAENTVGYVVVAGGGGGGTSGAGGGGGGGYREGRNVPIDNFTASPLVADSPTNAVTITATGFPITVGAGGAGATAPSSPFAGASGSNSVFSTITGSGGGGGGSRGDSPRNGINGGSGGGGGGGCGGSVGSGGTGNTPPVSPAQGTNGGIGGDSGSHQGGGGGGATAAGATVPGSGPQPGGNGGAGATSSITASPVARAGGGGGSGRAATGSPSGGSGGTGGGGRGESGSPLPAVAGTANTGGGGGGSEFLSNSGAAGGSGVVIIRYKFQ
tara:strand:- start:190 stop:1551 length:1362 start_codon:yes stop_codon:yes gene_type:complete